MCNSAGHPRRPRIEQQKSPPGSIVPPACRASSESTLLRRQNTQRLEQPSLFDTGGPVLPQGLRYQPVPRLAGAARTQWEHTIPPANQLRYSITFRNFIEISIVTP
jgi:hypothetical protein